MVTPWVPAMTIGCFGIRKSAVVADAAEAPADSKPALPGRTAEAVSSTAARSPLRKALSNLRDWFCRTFCCAPCSGIQRSVSTNSPTQQADVKPVQDGAVEKAQKPIDRSSLKKAEKLIDCGSLEKAQKLIDGGKPAASIQLKGNFSSTDLTRLHGLMTKGVQMGKVLITGDVSDRSALKQAADLAKKGADVRRLALKGYATDAGLIQHAGVLAQRGADVSEFKVWAAVDCPAPDLKHTLESLLYLQNDSQVKCIISLAGYVGPQDSAILGLLQQIKTDGRDPLLAKVFASGTWSCQSVHELQALSEANAHGLRLGRVNVTGSLDVKSATLPQVLALADSGASVKEVTVTGSETLAADDERRQLLARCRERGMSLEMPGEHPPS